MGLPTAVSEWVPAPSWTRAGSRSIPILHAAIATGRRGIVQCVLVLMGLLALAMPARSIASPYRVVVESDQDSDKASTWGARLAASGDALAVVTKGYDNIPSHLGMFQRLTVGSARRYDELRQFRGDGGLEEAYGASVVIDDDSVLVAAPDATVDGLAGAGAIYVYRRASSGNGWWRTQRLTAPTPVAGARFGYVLSAYLGVAWASERANGEGAVYRMQRTIDGSLQDPWRIRERIVLPEDVVGSGFGSAVQANLEGAYVAYDASPDHRSVAIFRTGLAETTTYQASIASPLAQPGDGFGDVLALTPDGLLVGAPARGRGAVDRFAWTLQGVLEHVGEIHARAGTDCIRFGAHIRPAWPSVVIAAPGSLDEQAACIDWYEDIDEDLVFRDSIAVPADRVMDVVATRDHLGCVIVYSNSQNGLYHYRCRDDGTLVQEEFVSQSIESGSFGQRVARSGDWLAVSRPTGVSGGGNPDGAVYVYRRVEGEWHYFQRILSDLADGPRNGGFGAVLAWSGTQLLILGPGGIGVYAPPGSGPQRFVLQQRIGRPDPGDGGYGNVVADGSRLYAYGGDGVIDAYAYDCCGIPIWSFRQRVVAGGLDRLTGPMSLDGDQLLAIGASFSDTGRLFEYSAAATAELTPSAAVLALPGARTPTYFLRSGEEIIVGTPKEGLGTDVRVLQRSGGGWAQAAILLPLGPEVTADHGASALHLGNRILVQSTALDGAPIVLDYRRQQVTWSMHGALHAPDGEGSFGRILAAVDGEPHFGTPRIGAEVSRIYALSADPVFRDGFE